MDGTATSVGTEGRRHESELQRHAEMVRVRAARLAEIRVTAPTADRRIEQLPPAPVEIRHQFAMPVLHLAQR